MLPPADSPGTFNDFDLAGEFLETIYDIKIIALFNVLEMPLNNITKIID